MASLTELVGKLREWRQSPDQYLVWKDGVETCGDRATSLFMSIPFFQRLVEVGINGPVIRNGDRAKVFTDDPVSVAHICDNLGLRPESTQGKTPSIFWVHYD